MEMPKFKRILIKLGTQVVTDENGIFAEKRIREILKDLKEFSDKEFLIVSSGAVGLGRNALGITKNISTSQKQACAAVGQTLLMNSYNKILSKLDRKAAQLLVTADDLTDRTKYLNFRETLNELLKLKTLPIINENDSISTVELATQQKSFGDNDKLSALVSSKMSVDLLIILTNVDGVYTDNPFTSKDAKKMSLIKNFDELKDVKAEGASATGRGGLKAKLEAVRVAALNGVFTVVAPGHHKNVINKILSTKTWGEHAPGTLILPASRISQRKNWIGFSSNTMGIVVVNGGAADALVNKKASLLPIGIVEVKGEFKSGEVLSIHNENGMEIGRGICDYSSVELNRLKGQKSEEVIHRDNLVIYKDYQL